MSQMVTRKSAVSEEKEKKRPDSPVKDMKKKMAANAEKEKQAAEKTTEKQPEKPVEKPKLIEKTPEKPKQAEKPVEKPKQAEKPVEKPKQADKPVEKPKQAEKPVEKPKQAEKPVEKPKQAEKPVEKPKQAEKPAEKPAADKTSEKKVEKNGVDSKKTEKKDTQEKKEDKAEKNGKSDTKKAEKPKQNGAKHNGESNGVEEGTVSEEEAENCDDEFPELAYDESDNESTEPERGPSRSFTRRSQVKATRTPETPLPATEKPAEGAVDESKDSKVLKLKDDATSTARKLRSADSPKPEKKQEDKIEENGEKDRDVEIIDLDPEEEPRKTDTNYSKSRVKVSPYRRSMRLADQTTSSVMANYTGNNTTMEMDLTESSIVEDPSLDDSAYLNGLRSIRGRRSYKQLKEITLKHVTANRSARSIASNAESSSRPTGTVVGRKRKPESDESVELGTEADEVSVGARVALSKRMRLLDRIAQPFRRTVATPLPARRNAEIVGINTDLPLTAPVAAPDTFDPESLKTAPIAPPLPAVPILDTERDSKRCIVM